MRLTACNKDKIVLLALALAIPAGPFCSCGTQRKLAAMQEKNLTARIQLPDEQSRAASFRQIDTSYHEDRDTITVNIDGHDMILMKAVLDDETGEMVAAQQLRAAVVTARFRNVAERHGKIDLEFQIIVPREMQDPDWQLRFHPDMYMLGDSIRLDDVLITGSRYREGQLRGYQQYERFLSRIVNDSTAFIDQRNLEIWISRNLPKLYAFRNDSSYVSDEQFRSYCGVSERQAIDHYTNKFAKRLNNRRKSNRERMFNRYVKVPVQVEHIRLDTIMRNADGDFVYNYIQTIGTRKALKKVDIVLSGEIYEADRRLYMIPRTEALSFYVSSLSSFVDEKEKYLTTVVERRVEANASWYIDFKMGRDDIDETLPGNAGQIENIKMNLRSLIENRTFDLDSITISAYASPEGSETANENLAKRRAGSAVNYFNAYVRHVQDSIRRESGFTIIIGEDMNEAGMESAAQLQDIRFISSTGGENWFLLDNLVENDSFLTREQKDRYFEIGRTASDIDSREKMMASEPTYKYIREELYPMLRTVEFNFFLHRHGMVKDTVHTTVLDTTYMNGVQAVRNRDYETAVKLLMPYNDYNTAIAYVSLDRNESALAILENLPRNAQVNYMLAVVYSRTGRIKDAIQCYLNACKQMPAYIHRGNLDPEIAALIRDYGLNRQEDTGDFNK